LIQPHAGHKKGNLKVAFFVGNKKRDQRLEDGP